LCGGCAGTGQAGAARFSAGVLPLTAEMTAHGLPARFFEKKGLLLREGFVIIIKHSFERPEWSSDMLV